MFSVLFCTNIPSPYRISFFNELTRYCNLTVCFERQSSSERDKEWVANEEYLFNSVFLRALHVKQDLSISLSLVRYIKTHHFDVIVFTNYVSPTTMFAINYCRKKRIPFYIEYDGGLFLEKENTLKKFIKKKMLLHASGHLTTSKIHKEYLVSLGIPQELIHLYPFSSVKNSQIKHIDINEKKRLRSKHGIVGNRIILSVGQYIYRKGFDVLLDSLFDIPSDVSVYIVGGKPTQEYLDKCKNLKCQVFFHPFQKPTEMDWWYEMADIFVLPTREDIWGLVINEAMAKGLPVISTTRCGAALEMIKDGKNGYLVQSENCEEMHDSIKSLIQIEDLSIFSNNSFETAKKYTIENMAKVNFDILTKNITA